MKDILIPFLMTLLAGLSTSIGSLIAFVAKKTNRKFLSVSLGFSAGVMIYVSLVEILGEAINSMVPLVGVRKGNWYAVIAFFVGMLIIAIIDKVIPEEENPHEMKLVEDRDNPVKLKRMGLFTALAIAIHNFPEGLATFISAMQDPSIAIPIVVAIAIHNIPEGIAVSIPIYQATGSKSRAFWYSTLSGIAEPVGAIIGYLFLLPIMSELVFGLIFAGVAGIMVFISFDELLPTAQEYGEHHLSLYGLIGGMAVMAVSLLLFL